MALSLDAIVLSDPTVSPHVKLKLDFVGFFNDWNTTKITDCKTSSRWSECIVNAYHLCAQAVTAETNSWWKYSRCMFAEQYPWEECASPNPWKNSTCTESLFPALISNVSAGCAAAVGIDQSSLQTCYDSGKGLELLKASFRKTVTFPKNLMGNIEPQWAEVNGPDCEQVGWAGCNASFDKTHCSTWDTCDSDAWALHIRNIVCKTAGLEACS
jgi:hypothetical protein